MRLVAGFPLPSTQACPRGSRARRGNYSGDGRGGSGRRRGITTPDLLLLFFPGGHELGRGKEERSLLVLRAQLVGLLHRFPSASGVPTPTPFCPNPKSPEHTTEWKPQKIMWEEVRKETGRWKDRWKIRDLLADERCSQVVLDFLAREGGCRLRRTLSEASEREFQERRERDEEKEAEVEELGARGGDLVLGRSCRCSYPRPHSWHRQTRSRGWATLLLLFPLLFPWGAAISLGQAWAEGKRGACNVPAFSLGCASIFFCSELADCQLSVALHPPLLDKTW